MATVVIVEDEDSLRETLSRYLIREGHEVISAASGHEALELGLDARPDVLIADWMLKNHIHGLHVSEIFRALHPRLNTILITGFPSRDLLEESDRRGVLRLLEKPFDLQELREALQLAMRGPETRGEEGPPIAAIAVDLEGGIQFASSRARELFAAAGVDGEVAQLAQVIEGEDAVDLLDRAQHEWVAVRPRGRREASWLVRTRRRPGRVGWLMVFCLREEEQRRTDRRLRLLLQARAFGTEAELGEPGPVVVIERDGVVRRLLVSQIERIGALCYPSDALESALRLLAAEPRARTVLIDAALAGDELGEWVERIREVCPEAQIIGTGGVGAESELLAQGVSRVLRKPWRIVDLAAVLEG